MGATSQKSKQKPVKHRRQRTEVENLVLSPDADYRIAGWRVTLAWTGTEGHANLQLNL